MDKLIYFLNHSIRKCRITGQTLVAMNYHEQGRITLETLENDPGAVEVDPLA